MDNAQKAIIIGVALFITIALISAVMIITGIGTDMMGTSNRQLEGVSESIASQLLSDYNDTVMTGASVIASIKKFYDKPNFLLLAETNEGLKSFSTLKIKDSDSSIELSSSAYKFSGTVEENSPTITGLSKKITSTSNYHSYIIYQKGTDTVLGLYFAK